MSGEKQLSTEDLLKLLFKEQSLDSFMSQSSSDFLIPNFSEYISKLCSARGEFPEKAIARAGLEKSYGHKVFAGKRNPSRDTVIQLAFGLELDVVETQELLKIARKSTLYMRVKRDTALIYCLHNHIPLVETQIVLRDLGLPILGERSKNG